MAPAGPSVFGKKFKMLLLRVAEEDDLALEGPLDGVEAFRAVEPAMARRLKSASRRQKIVFKVNRRE